MVDRKRIAEIVYQIAYRQYDFYRAEDTARVQTVPDSVSIDCLKTGFWVFRDSGEIVEVFAGGKPAPIPDEPLVWIPPGNIIGIQRSKQIRR